LLERAVGLAASYAASPKQLCDVFGRRGEEFGPQLNWEEDDHRHHVEDVVHGGGGEGALELLASPDVPQRRDRAGDRGADVRAHDHRHCRIDGQRPRTD
jgi:hypothetical protein